MERGLGVPGDAGRERRAAEVGAWRNQFSGTGLLLAALALFGGSLFLTVYLFILAGQSKGDMRAVLLGQARAAL